MKLNWSPVECRRVSCLHGWTVHFQGLGERIYCIIIFDLCWTPANLHPGGVKVTPICFRTPTFTLVNGGHVRLYKTQTSGYNIKTQGIPWRWSELSYCNGTQSNQALDGSIMICRVKAACTSKHILTHICRQFWKEFMHLMSHAAISCCHDHSCFKNN